MSGVKQTQHFTVKISSQQSNTMVVVRWCGDALLPWDQGNLPLLKEP
uniref:Uncharacterized protein n=1 Tax=Anguilla anguilla TaxID=7936 RepID=A0A0E9QTK1_ANGAN